MPDPTFYVRDIPVYGDVILSPMAGYSDVPYRALCREFGSAMNYTEFVAAEMLQSDKPNRYWNLLDFRAGERPMVFQIFGNNPEKLLAAAQRIEQWGPDIIDINMGCSTRKVSGRGAGVAMMRDPKLVETTFKLLTKHLRVPVTAKMRLGWDEQVNYLEIARILEANGAALIAMHARTKQQKYGGRATWAAIAALKAAVSVPVIGNGDVCAPADIDRMRAETGCDAVMVGRGAIGNPWLIGRADKSALALADIAATMRRHLGEMAAYYGERWGAIQFRKHCKQYLADRPAAATFMPRLMLAPDAQTALGVLDEMVRAAPVEGMLVANRPARASAKTSVWAPA